MVNGERRKRNLYFVQAAFTLGGSKLREHRVKTNVAAGLSVRYARRLRYKGVDPQTGKFKKYYFKSSTAKGAAVKAGKAVLTAKAKKGTLKGVGVMLVTVSLARRSRGRVDIVGKPRTYKVFRRRISPENYDLTRSANKWRPAPHTDDKHALFKLWHTKKIVEGAAEPTSKPWIPRWKWYAVPVNAAPKSDAISSMYKKIASGALPASSTLSQLFGRHVVVPKKKRTGGRKKRTGLWRMLF